MLKRLRIGGVAVMATLFMASAASAATLIDFRDADGVVMGGVIQYSPGNAVGSGIGIGQVFINGAPLFNGVHDVTGNNGGFGELAFNTNTGAISITGCIADLGVGTGGGGCDPVLLLTGTITAYNVTPNNGFGSGSILLGGFDIKHEDLLAAIGLPTDAPFTFFGSDITTLPNGNGSAQSSSVDIANTTAAHVPEPATMVLLGTGLLAAFRARRRQA